VIEYFLDLFF